MTGPGPRFGSIRSVRRRVKRSDHVSSGAVAMPFFGQRRGEGGRVGCAAGKGRQKVDAVAHGLGSDGGAARAGAGVAGGVTVAELADVGGVGGDRQDRGAIVHQGLVALVRAVPFQHGELDPVARPALAVSPDAGEGEDLLLPRRQQLLHREFGGGVEVAAPRGQCRVHHLDPDRVQVGSFPGEVTR
jgi:hypothetical protein